MAWCSVKAQIQLHVLPLHVCVCVCVCIPLTLSCQNYIKLPWTLCTIERRRHFWYIKLCTRKIIRRIGSVARTYTNVTVASFIIFGTVLPNLLWTCNVKLSLYLTKYHAMKTYGRVEVKLHAFLTSAPDGGEWSASRPGRFIPGESASRTHWIDWVGPRAHEITWPWWILKLQKTDISCVYPEARSLFLFSLTRN
jgi:hypothetical protein